MIWNPANLPAGMTAPLPVGTARLRSTLCLLILLTLPLSLVYAQTAAGTPPGEQQSAAGDEVSGEATSGEANSDEATPGEATSGEVENQFGIAAFGVSAGFPAYQTVALNASVQYRYVGFAARGAYTSAAGLYGSLAVRGYPPIPGTPVPLFIEVGAGVHRGGVAPFAAIGGHVPLARRVRLDIEAGAARVPLLNEYNTVPFLSVGVSYAFSFDAGELIEANRAEREARRAAESRGTATVCDAPPDPGLLSRAVDRTVEDWIEDAQATYGSLYSGLRYSYSMGSRRVRGNEAEVRVNYSGSAREIATGTRHSAEGRAEATFVWNGCTWSNTGVRY